MVRPSTGSVLVSLSMLALLAVVCLKADPLPWEAVLQTETAKPALPAEQREVVVLPPPPAPRSSVQAQPLEAPAVPADEESSESEPVPEAPSPKPPPAVRTAPTQEARASTLPATQRPGSPAPQTPASPPPEITVNRQAVREGRVLLVMMAEGKGPNIEIAWPDDGARRDRLYRLLARCYGMKSAVLQRDSTLFLAEGKPGKPWQINRDYYSSFLREPQGRVPSAERKEIAKIEAYHGVRGTAVRVLPRVVDAGIVGALFNLAGSDTRGNAAITASYDFDEKGLMVSEISADGRPLGGVLRVPRIVGGCRA